MQLILIISIVYIILAFTYRSYLPFIRGRQGERRVARQLGRLNPGKYRVLNDLYIHKNGRSTQIDHVVVSIYGIYIIETKNYTGWIHGHQNSEYWTQSIFSYKFKLRNPIKQNWSHIYALKSVLKEFQGVNYHPIVVFTGNVRLINVHTEIPVLYSSQLYRCIKSNNVPINLTIEQVKEIIEQLKAQSGRNRKIRKEHIRYIKKRTQEHRQQVKLNICPRCNSSLVLRNGQYGKFFGCSNYPKCKYTKRT